MLESNVFQRTETSDPVISATLFNMVVGLVLCWGFAINWAMVEYIDPEAIAQINPFVFLIGYFACAMLGTFIFSRSENPAVSFIGYNLVVIPFGLVVNIAVHQYNPEIVGDAIRITGLATAGMMVLATLFPAFFARIGPALFFSLIAVIVVELVEILVFNIHHGILDWVVAIIFCGYIGYDWGRANSIPKTFDNAVDSAAALYIDIIVLFLRVLSILGRRD